MIPQTGSISSMGQETAGTDVGMEFFVPGGSVGSHMELWIVSWDTLE
jgi:hypothetical protein